MDMKSSFKKMTVIIINDQGSLWQAKNFGLRPPRKKIIAIYFNPGFNREVGSNSPNFPD
jgi:hypothetical protein